MTATRIQAHFIFFFVSLAVVFLLHASVIGEPYFWDELGQFVPASLDLFQRGLVIPQTTLPNVHPPGLMAVLAGWWSVFGYSVVATRCAMLLFAGSGLYLTFLLAIEMTKGIRGAPAFLAAVLLAVCPLFWAQAMLAQLDLPAMTFTVLALLLFLRRRSVLAAIACVALVSIKETGVVLPGVLCFACLVERRWKAALVFTLPAVMLATWLILLHAKTGFWFGNAEFTQYNTSYSFHPARLALTMLRRLYFLFIDNFHFIGTLALIAALRRRDFFQADPWRWPTVFAVAHTFVVSVFGGAALERYLLPVLPIFFIAASAALMSLPDLLRRIASGIFVTGLAVSLFLPSPIAYPLENRYEYIDQVRLHKEAAQWLERTSNGRTILTAWPFSDALRRQEFGYVRRPLPTVNTIDFSRASLRKVQGRGSLLVVYSRTWTPPDWVGKVPVFLALLQRLYGYERQATQEEIESDLGLVQLMRWERGGQWLEVYTRQGPHADFM